MAQVTARRRKWSAAANGISHFFKVTVSICQRSGDDLGGAPDENEGREAETETELTADNIRSPPVPGRPSRLGGY